MDNAIKYTPEGGVITLSLFQNGEADAFYGYYTLHTLESGQIEGMLSINGYSGAVWYHSWHGAFMGMEEYE